VRSERIGGRILLVSAASTLALVAVYFLDYSRPRWYAYASGPSAILEGSATVLATGLGPAAALGGPAVGLLAAAIVAVALGALATSSARAPEETLRRLGFAASIAGVLGLVLSIGVGRGDAVSAVPRYFGLAAPLLSASFLAWTAYGEPRARSLACGGLALVAWAAVLGNVRAGEAAGTDIRYRSRQFEALVAGGASPAELVREYTDLFPFHFVARSEWILTALAARRDPPFDRGRTPSPRSLCLRAFDRVPSKVESDETAGTRLVDGRDVLVVHAGTAIHLDLAAGDSRITGTFGVPPELYEGRRSNPIHVRVEFPSSDGTTRTLFDRELDPASNASDRGPQSFEVDGLPPPPGELVLRVDGEAAQAAKSWAYWYDVRIE
jgi:hypothetical protein